MEKFYLNYSLKNIPVGNNDFYLTRFYDMVAKFINRVRWKAYWFTDDKDDGNTDDNTLHRFPSRNSAPKSEHLTRFEEDLYDAIKKIKFRRFTSEFQNQLNKDISEIKKSKEVLVCADKTTNIYKVPVPVYNKLISKAINKDYKKAPKNALENINNDAASIIEKNQIKGKVPKYEQKEAFITIKDHKDGFPTNIKTRLINPAKSHIGKVAKEILDEINCTIRSKTNLVQWKNTQEVIQWFEDIPHKENKCFIKYDIVDFYPSITSDSITKALKFARSHTTVSKEDEIIIRHSCNTLMFHNNEPWVKTKSDGYFDVPMGSFYGAELCELVGLFILNSIAGMFSVGHCGLYRDDGLAVIKNKRRCNLMKIEQQIRRVLCEIGFKITIESGLVSTDFLDVNLDLSLNSFSPFRKANSKIMYVNKQSNHPPSITKSIPKMVVGRLCRLSKDEVTYNNHCVDYLNELKLNGYETKDLKFEKKCGKKRKRRRKIIYFHPPFCKSVKTKIGRIFRELVEKHFTPEHPFYKILNKNTLKISYSCLPNMKAVLNAHNKKVTNKDDTSKTKAPLCNCEEINKCPVEGRCLLKNVVYKADVSTKSTETKSYIGSTKRAFKKRYEEHLSSFEGKRTGTKLSRYIEDLKYSNQKYNIRWKIIKQSHQSSPNIKFCTLCNLERMEIARATKRNLLNSRNELVTQCPHNPKMFFGKYNDEKT
jgi:hypothetical protein